jgi:hypothetical protein
MRWFVCIVAVAFSALITAAEPAAEGAFENAACVACHQTRDGELVNAWRRSGHGTTADTVTCVTCHGSSHNGAAQRARRDEHCAACHGGDPDPVVRSYATSKHGVISQLEQDDWDWSRRLVSANYRAPGCAYCHMHNGDHDVGSRVRSWAPLEEPAARERERLHYDIQMVCQDCHSSRYVERLLDNGERMLTMGRMKVREAASIIERASRDFGDPELAEAQDYFSKMRSLHLKNLYLGSGHQSPDYQWWHGQPALDGDLLRIKSAISELHRIRAIANGRTAE